MNIPFLMIVTAISGLIYTFARIQREYISPVFSETLFAIILVGATLLFVAMVNYLTVRALERTKKHVPSELLQLTISVILYTVCGILIIKFVYGKDITTLLATSAIVTVGLGLGLREPLGHLFSGLTLEIERPLAVGDYIRTNDQTGRVESLNWRAVRIRTKDNSLVIMPNSELADKSAELFPVNMACRHHVEVGIPSDVPPAKVLGAATEVMSDNIPFIGESRNSGVQVTGYDPMSGSIKYEIYFTTDEFLRVEQIKSAILERLWYALARNGVDVTRLSQGVRLHRLIGEGTGEDEAKATTRADRLVEFLSRFDTFKDVPTDALNSLAERLDPIVYTTGETIRVHLQRPESIFIIRRGRVTVQYGSALRNAEHDDVPGAEASTVTYPDASHWNRNVLDQIAEHMTYYLGPVARHLVESEARNTSDAYDLYHRLARFIDDGDGRNQFLSRGPDTHTQELIEGDGLCSIQGQRIEYGKGRAIAREETELLELKADDLVALTAEVGSLGNALATYVDCARDQAQVRIQLENVEQVPGDLVSLLGSDVDKNAGRVVSNKDDIDHPF